MKAPEVELVMPRVGWSFQLLLNSVGRLMPVSQLSSLEKSPTVAWFTVMESVGSGVEGSGIFWEAMIVGAVVFRSV